MIRICLKPVVTVLCLTLLAAVIPSAYKQAKAADGDSSGIRQTMARYTNAFNRHDAHGLSMSFAEDADFTNPRGIYRHGRKEIEDRFASVFGGYLSKAHETCEVKRV